MRTITDHIHLSNTASSELPRTIPDLLARRHSPVFFENDRISVALPLLQSAPFHAGGVTDTDGRFCGLLAESDILYRVFARSTQPEVQDGDFKKYVGDMTAGDAMIRHPETLDDDTPPGEALAFMQKRGYAIIPVVSRFDDTRLVGIIGLEDLSACLCAGNADGPAGKRKSRAGIFRTIAEACRAGYLSVET